MSCVCILTPVMIAAWPAFSAAVVSAAASLGYTILNRQAPGEGDLAESKPDSRLTLEVANSEIVTDQLGRDQQIAVTRDGITVTFSRDPRGRASICVSGTGQSEAVLRAHGEELSRRLVQQYVYQRLRSEMAARDFVILEEETDSNHAIRLKVRHWEN